LPTLTCYEVAGVCKKACERIVTRACGSMDVRRQALREVRGSLNPLAKRNQRLHNLLQLQSWPSLFRTDACYHPLAPLGLSGGDCPQNGIRTTFGLQVDQVKRWIPRMLSQSGTGVIERDASGVLMRISCGMLSDKTQAGAWNGPSPRLRLQRRTAAL